MEDNTSVPAWDDIRFITNDLKQVMDDFDDDSSPIPAMRARLARTIAEMRDEKGLEEQRRVTSISNPFRAIQEMTLEIRARLEEVRRKR